jgi:UDPglucose 6-dehydrogenase
MRNIGVIGQGFVGSAVREGLSPYYNMLTYDIDTTKSNCENITDVIKGCDIIFQCLPTPMKRSGMCDISIVTASLAKIDDICGTLNCKENKVIIVKSTIPPGTTKKLDKKFVNIDICFSPEFLTEANSFNDFKNQNRIIVGGPRPATTKVKQMFRRAFPTIPIVKTGSDTAEMVKYFINCFLATKVTFANEMYDICQSVEIDMDKVTEYALYDARIGKSHLAVPGPDGDRGFGGHCFPKDLSAMIYFGKNFGINTDLLESVKSKNDKVRVNRDWEAMKGRAVSED